MMKGRRLDCEFMFSCSRISSLCGRRYLVATICYLSSLNQILFFIDFVMKKLYIRHNTLLKICRYIRRQRVLRAVYNILIFYCFTIYPELYTTIQFLNWVCFAILLFYSALRATRIQWKETGTASSPSLRSIEHRGTCLSSNLNFICFLNW